LLEQAGLFAAQDFTCCSSCGHAEASGAMTERKSRGYVFYHQQDTERGIEGGGLMLAFGSWEGEDEKTTAIGREISDALSRFGVPHDWNGSPERRIEISPFEWRRRRVTTAPRIPLGSVGIVIARKEDDVDETPAEPREPQPDARLVHPDGRVWTAMMGYGELVLTIRDVDGDEFKRTVKCANPRAELDSRVAELKSDGFAINAARAYRAE